MRKGIIVMATLLLVLSGCSSKNELEDVRKDILTFMTSRDDVEEMSLELLQNKGMNVKQSEAFDGVIETLMSEASVSQIQMVSAENDTTSYVVTITSNDAGKVLTEHINDEVIASEDVFNKIKEQNVPVETTVNVVYDNSSLSLEDKEEIINALWGDINSYELAGLKASDEVEEDIKELVFDKVSKPNKGVSESSLKSPLKQNEWAQYTDNGEKMEIRVNQSQKSVNIAKEINGLSEFNNSLKPGYRYVKFKVSMRTKDAGADYVVKHNDFKAVSEDGVIYPGLIVFGSADEVRVTDIANKETSLDVYMMIKQNTKNNKLIFKDYNDSFLTFEIKD